MNIQFYRDELGYVNAKLHPLANMDPQSFLGTFLQACLRADFDNYELLRPALLALKQKYPADPERLQMEHSDNEET